MSARKAPRALQKTASEVSTNAAAEKARKAASRAALRIANAVASAARESAKAEATAFVESANPVLLQAAALNTEYDEARAREANDAEIRREQDKTNALVAHRVDFEALMPEGQTFGQYLAEQGVAPDGSPLALPKVGYDGPMLALRAASLGYVRGIHNGDTLASLLDGLDRKVVCTALIKAMKLEGNPYRHLNPGQQSMNLRNKARGQLKSGLLTMVEISDAISSLI